jgi:hypothetical protein
MNAWRDSHACAVAAAMRLYGRPPEQVIADLQNLATALVAEVDSWQDVPTARCITNADSQIDGMRRLLGQLRLAAQQAPRDAA